MRRFWKDVSVEVEDNGFGVRLDGRPVRTPARAPLAVPARALAEAVADEWREVGEKADPRAMPLTGLANAAIDQVGADEARFAAGLARYGEADLACYRAEGPSALIERQKERWDALLGWARRRYDVDFATTSGLLHVPQPSQTVDQLRHAVTAFDAFQLAALSPIVTIGGSLIGALAIAEKAIPAEQVWDAVTLDEQWQLEQWGSDSEAELALENRRADFFAAVRFLELLET